MYGLAAASGRLVGELVGESWFRQRVGDWLIGRLVWLVVVVVEMWSTGRCQLAQSCS